MRLVSMKYTVVEEKQMEIPAHYFSDPSKLGYMVDAFLYRHYSTKTSAREDLMITSKSLRAFEAIRSAYGTCASILTAIDTYHKDRQAQELKA